MPIHTQTRDQIYADDAYKRVNGIYEKGKTLIVETERKAYEQYYKKYGGFSHKLPILIRTAGLAQALSFVEARGKKPGEHLLTDLAATVGQENMATLTHAARTVQLNEYMRLTQQVMDALLWYKRFAQSILGVEQDQANAVTEDTVGGKE